MALLNYQLSNLFLIFTSNRDFVNNSVSIKTWSLIVVVVVMIVFDIFLSILCDFVNPFELFDLAFSKFIFLKFKISYKNYENFSWKMIFYLTLFKLGNVWWTLEGKTFFIQLKKHLCSSGWIFPVLHARVHDNKKKELEVFHFQMVEYVQSE